jgi:hypothetical protein
VEAHGFGFEAVLVLLALEAHFDRDIEEECEVRCEAAGREVVQAAKCWDVEAAGVALVGDARVSIAVAKDDRATLECGHYHLSNVLSAGCEEEKQFSLGCDVAF